MHNSYLGFIEMLSIFGIGIGLVLWQVIATWRERRRDRQGPEARSTRHDADGDPRP